MIWRAPWGKHIDLDRIVEVSDPVGVGRSFAITYQLIDVPIVVGVSAAYYAYPKGTGEGKGYVKEGERPVDVVNRWHEELMKTWAEHKKS